MPDRIDISERVRDTSKLEDVEITDKTREERKQARIAAFRIATKEQETEHLKRLAEDIVDDHERGLHPAGHRGGRRVRLVWASATAFNRWQSKFSGLPAIGNRYALTIGAPAYEFPGDEVTPPSGRPFTEVQLSEEEQDWFEANGVTLAEAGGFDPLTDNEILP